MTDRFPAVPGALGLRDLGGLPRSGNEAPTRSGTVFAGGRRERLTEDGVRALGRLGVGIVLDLRTAEEHGRRPSDPVTDEALWDTFEIHDGQIEDFTLEEYTAALDWPFLNHPKHYPFLLAHFPDRLAAAARVLVRAADRGVGVYVHCSAGRDRTGLFASWLLQLAGVEIPVIVTEYVRSLGVVNDHHRTSGHPVEHFMPPEEFGPWSQERAEALSAFLRTHPARPTLCRLGLSAGEIDALASLLA
ncbi:tyrosine-protein phosphatase [Brevibacterium samyangense]|uniref:Tyrosine specific protein phosphatases domain-containing protein n=1 Tax=Brevibacterium samyangense TaxID=366888 RepID=A0ABP5EY40_9MICO